MASFLWVAVWVVECVFAVLMAATIVAGWQKMEEESPHPTLICLGLMVAWLAAMLCIYAAARGLLA